MDCFLLHQFPFSIHLCAFKRVSLINFFSLVKAPPLGVGFWSVIAHEFLAQGQGFAALSLKGEVFTPSKNSLELNPGGGGAGGRSWN